MNSLSKIASGASLMACLFAGCSTPPGTAAERTEQTADVAATKEAVLKRDPSLTKRFDEAYGYVIFPSVAKGAAGIGGAFGRGQVYKQGEFIGYASLTQGTIGAALGGQTYAEVVFFKDDYALNRLTGGSMELAAQVSAVMVKEGASAQADYSDGVMVFTMPLAGAMFEASIGGQKFDYVSK